MLAFGITTSTTPTGQQTYVIDNGGDLSCAILRGGTTSSTIHLGDLTSIKYKNQELLAPYATTSRYSHYEQGLSNTTVITTATGGTAGSRWILVACDDTAGGGVGVVQYYAVRENDTNLYLSSYVPNPTSEGRFIAYLSRSVFTNPEAPSDNDGTTGAIEGSDVFGHADGTTSSKFFNVGGRRQIDHVSHGLTGTAGSTPVGAWMFMGSRERSSGGPFFKDINYQSSSAVEIYNCIFTGHTQTEAYRAGLHTFALQVNGGQAPTEPSYTWLENLRDLATNTVLIQGLIPASQRGGVAGTATGIAVGRPITVGLANAAAQYWDVADASGGFAIPNVLPGTYTETLYDGELEVGRRAVTVAAGATTTANIVNSFYLPANPIFRIGTFDGSPIGFLNADKIETMHPSDIRMANWAGLPNFVVGTNTDAQFPMAQFMGVNNSQRFTFTLSAAQVQNLTFRVGITLGFSGARPKITVNAGQSYAWTSGNPTASSDLNSRGVTRGTWRGNNQLYTFGIPSTSFRAGTNTIDMGMISGSYVSGQTWLSPNAVFDAIDLVPTSSASPPTISAVTIAPANATVGSGVSRAFAATASTATGTVAANIDWSATLGSVTPSGTYTAPAATGSDTLSAVATVLRTPGYSTGTGNSSVITDSLTATGTTTLTIVPTTPVVVTPAAAAPTPNYAKTAVLTALGSDDDGEAALTYTWGVVGTPPGAVSFSAANGTNAGKSTSASFAAAGTYTLQVTITDATGKSATSQTTLVVRNADTQLLADEASGTALADATGNGNAATLSGATAFVPGINGNAVRFTGGSASLPVGIVSGLADFTIAAWVKPDSIATWQRIFDFGSSTSSTMFLTTRPTTTGGLRFAINAGSGEQRVNTLTALTVGVWQHVAVTLRGNTATVYVDGVAAGTNNGVTLRPSSLGQTTNNFIGKSQFAADPTLTAAVDDFRIYSRGLTAAEVQALARPDVTLTVPTGQTVTDAVLRTGRGALVKEGLGTLVLDKPNTHTGGTVVNAGTIVVRDPSALGSGGLRVKAGALVQLDVGGGTVSLSSIVLEAGARVDLGVGRLLLAAGSMTAADVLAQVVAGRGDGSWNGGSGFLTRSAAPDRGLGLGFLVNDDGSILVAYAAAGDINLDGQVDVVDLSTLIGGGTLDSVVVRGWADGDFNYDGLCDVLDVVAFLASGLYDTGPYG